MRKQKKSNNRERLIFWFVVVRSIWRCQEACRTKEDLSEPSRPQQFCPDRPNRIDKQCEKQNKLAQRPIIPFNVVMFMVRPRFDFLLVCRSIGSFYFVTSSIFHSSPIVIMMDNRQKRAPILPEERKRKGSFFSLRFPAFYL